MILLENYKNFINKLKLESVKNFPLFLSKQFRDMLNNIDHDIARELLSKHSDLDSRVPQTFIDVHPTKDSQITFIQPNKAMTVLGWEIENDDEVVDFEKSFDVSVLNDITDDNSLYKKFRSNARLGVFIRNTFPGKFSQSLPGGQNTKDIESFVNLYKALYNRTEKFDLFEIIEGDAIAEWYNGDNYEDSEEGNLNDSCMKEMPPETFEIYVKNARMLIMYSDSSKEYIKGRANLWNLKVPEGRIFMDRIYTNDFSDQQVYIDYAKKNGWLYKSSQSMGANISIIDSLTDNQSHITMMAQLNIETLYEQFPYMDTLCYYSPTNGKISNKTKIYDSQYNLTETDGEYYMIDEYDEDDENERTINYVRSNYEDDDIDEEDATYCKLGDDWVITRHAIRVYNTVYDGEIYATPDYDEIVKSSFIKPNGDRYIRHFQKNKCIWSDHLNTWVFNSNHDIGNYINNNWKSGAKLVWANLDRTDSIIEHSNRKDTEFFEINGEFWYKDLVKDGELIGEITPKIDKPVGEVPRGWHLRSEFIDSEGNIFNKGIFVGKQ